MSPEHKRAATERGAGYPNGLPVQPAEVCLMGEQRAEPVQQKGVDVAVHEEEDHDEAGYQVTGGGPLQNGMEKLPKQKDQGQAENGRQNEVCTFWSCRCFSRTGTKLGKLQRDTDADSSPAKFALPKNPYSPAWTRSRSKR